MTRLIGFLGLALLAVSIADGQEPPRGSPLASLVDTERAFSRMSVAEGTRAAFLANFAESGVSFSPEPVNTRDTFSRLPATPSKIILEWVPVTADVSSAGDLGYTTGPWVRSERTEARKPVAWGWYFTVWKKQADGTWKALADIGTTTPAHALPGAGAFRAARSAGRASAPATSQGSPGEAGIMDADRALSDRAGAGALEAYLAFAADEIRLHRDGLEPIVGVAALKSYLAGKSLRTTSTTMAADVSRSGDLGYAYGSYVSRSGEPATSAEERGYYLRVWKRLETGWRLVADITNPEPAPK